MADRDTVRDRLLAIIAIVLVIAILRASYAVTMPLCAALVIIAAVWPVKPWLDRALPSSLGTLGAVLLLLAILVAFCAAIYFSAAQVVDAFVRNEVRFQQVYGALLSRLNEWGLPDPGGREGYSRLIGLGRTVLANAYTVVVYLGFIAVLVILGLPEIHALGSKIKSGLNGSEQKEVLDIVDQIASKVRAYLGTSTLTSLLTGGASAVWALVLGLDLALVWGVLNFLLNYIPLIGNIVGILPPTLYAVIQFDGWAMPLVVLVGFAVIQIVISNLVYPTLQGHSLSLSPFAIVLALAFWSWVWGIAGALIAIPLTAAAVIVCEHFRSTRWVATLLSKPDEGGRG